jgi:hypothetical protein
MISMLLRRWLPTFLGFPLGGFLAIEVAEPIDSPARAALAGLLAGAVLGGAQWLALRSRGVGPRWAILTAAGMSAGSAAAAAVTDGGTTIATLMVAGLVTGLVVGAAQSSQIGRGPRVAATWTAVSGMTWALGWLVSANVIVDAERGYVIFGASGAILVTVATGLVLRRLLDSHGVQILAGATATTTPVAATLR